MGYLTKDIAVLTEPQIISLAGAPNFVTFASKPAVKTYIDIDVQIAATPATPANNTLLRVTEAGGTVHDFRGTTNPDNVAGSTFLIAADKADTAENLREALLAIDWIAANFDIQIAAAWVGGQLVNGDTLTIKGKGAGDDFELAVLAPNNGANTAYVITTRSAVSTDTDSIKGNAAAAEIELDVYEDPDTMLGGDDRPTTTARAGRYIVSLQKTYTGAPVWFDVNGPFSRYGGYKLPPLAGWADTGTAKKFRFIAKVRAANSRVFYYSNALYAINGYNRLNEQLTYADHVFTGDVFDLLTEAPTVPHVRGQKAYLNFIYSQQAAATIAVEYSAFSRAGNFIGRHTTHSIPSSQLHIVNTLALDIDAVLDMYPSAGEVRAAVTSNGVLASSAQAYRIMPECLHDLREFVFLNRLGGWDVFNFDAAETQDITREAKTYSTATTPTSVGGPLHVYGVDLTDTYTVEGAPVSDDVAEWLKQFAASRVILDSQLREIIIEDFTLSIGENGLHVPTLKYRLNDTFTNE